MFIWNKDCTIYLICFIYLKKTTVCSLVTGGIKSVNLGITGICEFYLNINKTSIASKHAG